MCQFKSGIITKTRIFLAMGEDDSHSRLLNEIGIADATENAMTIFVRAELIPPKNEWWTDPESWKFEVDQDILPEWFEVDPEKYEKEFRESVKEWWAEHVFIDARIEKLSSGYYRLMSCQVEALLNDVVVVLNNSTVQNMWGSSTVRNMRDNSTVQNMWDNSTVQNMWDNSTVGDMWGSSTVRNMWDNSTVQNMWDSSTVRDMWGSSTVRNMRNNSTVQNMWDNSTVQNMWDNSTVGDMRDNSTVRNMRGNSIARNLSAKKIHVSGDSNYAIEVKENADS